MRSESDKGQDELAIFRKFVDASAVDVVSASVRKGDARLREPDVLCTLSGGEDWAFELAEACAPEFAAAASKARKTGVEVAWGGDVTCETVRMKLRKRYAVACPIDLLLYFNGFTALRDESIVDAVRAELADGRGPFRRIWVFGNGKVHEV